MILITGCTGFVGGHLATTLADDGFEIRCLVRGNGGPESMQNPRITLATGDISNPDSLREAVEGAETVIHLVGIIRERGASTFERVHVDGTRNLIEASKLAGVKRFIYQSAIGAREGGVSGYQTTKWKAEELTKSSGMEWVITRPSIIIGRNGEFVKTLKDLVMKGPVIPVVGSGEYRLQPLFIGDLCRAFEKILANPGCWGKTYELAGPDQLTFNRMLELTAEALHAHKRLVHIPLSLFRPLARAMEAILPNPPITHDQLAMLSEDNVTNQDALREIFGIEPTPFKAAIESSL